MRKQRRRRNQHKGKEETNRQTENEETERQRNSETNSEKELFRSRSLVAAPIFKRRFLNCKTLKTTFKQNKTKPHFDSIFFGRNKIYRAVKTVRYFFPTNLFYNKNSWIYAFSLSSNRYPVKKGDIKFASIESHVFWRKSNDRLRNK